MKDLLLDLAGSWAVRGAAFLAQVLPERTALGLGRTAGTAFYFVSSRRRQAYADLKAAFGEKMTPRQLRQTVRRHYAHIGQSAAEFLRFPLLNGESVRQKTEILRLETFQQAAAQGRGVLLLTAHLGNWELLQIVSSLLGRPIHALMREQKHTRLNAFLNHLREIKGSRVVRNRGMDLRALVRALKNGELVGVLADQSAGKMGGMILPFFGRKTTVPTGSFELAGRTGAILLPAFIARGPQGRHLIRVEDPLPCPGADKTDSKFEASVRAYLKLVEERIRENPDQWLWAKKRWKYSWTKRLVILSDGKPGHVKQSQAVAQAFREVTAQYGRPGMEYPLEVVRADYKSEFHRILFHVAAVLLLPWIQGRLAGLRFFLTEESSRAVEKAQADFVISTGSSLVPLNLMLARENCAKSAVILKPPFPYGFFRYDLSVVPAHDSGWIPRESLRLLLTPSSPADAEAFGQSGTWADEVSHPESVENAVFLGGPTRGYKMEASAVRALMEALEKTGSGYLVTTSRRTPPDVERALKDEAASRPGCRKLVIASEDKRSGIAEGMMAMAGTLIVTEDSVSMISEAVRSGKRVIVFAAGDSSRLPAKHRRFLALLEEKHAVTRASAADAAFHLAAAREAAGEGIAENEKNNLRRRLQEIL
ncbi:MAG: hypothetical protein FGM27_02905 [Candidatus Omnitrophica bacterium]|nr:hypothetical protein [Candidatus Omnitrophota bacterium]